MNTNEMILAYPEAGLDVRTISKDNEIYFCLVDVVKILQKQNINLANKTDKVGLTGMAKALISVVRQDEQEIFSGLVYITQAGLFRIIMRDESDACIKFQDWVFKDVLPSIQKHGTYPPPLVSQNSDVKRIVQSLLLEIEQREELERKTKEQFAIHEQKLNQLGEKLDSISTDSEGTSFISIGDFCQEKEISLTDKQMILGWCIKICAEENERTKKHVNNGEEELMFTANVLNSALERIAKGRTSNP